MTTARDHGRSGPAGLAITAVVGTLIGALLCCSGVARAETLYTLNGMPEFDRSAGAWVLCKYKYPNATVAFVEQTNIPAQSVSFDFSDASIERKSTETAFEASIRFCKVQDKALALMVPILRDIEINKWGKKKTAEAPGIVLLHNGLLLSCTNETQVMKGHWLLLDAMYAYYQKLGGK